MPGSTAFLTVGNDGTLTDERAIITGTNLSANDGGADSTYTLDVIDDPTFSGLLTANGDLTVQTGDTFTFNGDAFTDLTGTGLSVSTGSLQTTLGTSVDLTSEVNGILPVANGGTGANSLSDLIALTTHTTGNYVATLTNGSGISGSSSTEGGTPTIALGPLTADWDQTGAFDITLNNSGSEVRILESTGGTFYGRLDVGDLTADRTYTFPDADGAVCLDSGNCIGGSGGASNSAAYLTVGNDGTLTDERAIAVNATNLSFSDGGADSTYTIDTIQDIATSSSPSFSGLTLTGNLGIAANTIQGTTAVIDFTNFDVASNGNITAGTYNGQTISSSANLTGTVTVAGLTTLNGDLTVQTGDTFTFNGDAFTDLTGTGLSVSTGSLQTTLGTSVDLTSEVNGILPVANGGTGANSLSDLIALTTHTTGNYVATLTNGSGISGSSSTEGGTPTIALGPLTADWDQTGAFDITLNNSGSEVRILESTGGTFYGRLDVGDLTADRTYTFPDADGAVCLDSGNCIGGSGGASNNCSILTVGNDATLTDERAITAGTNLSATDGGINSTYTLDVI